MEKKWQQFAVGILLAGSFVSTSVAHAAAFAASQPNRSVSSRRGTGFGFAAMLEKTVNLTPEQNDAVRGLLAEQRRQSQALREQTDAKIRGLLNAEQQKKFDAFLAEQKTRRAGRRSNPNAA